jgi:hypothetical protein
MRVAVGVVSLAVAAVFLVPVARGANPPMTRDEKIAVAATHLAAEDGSAAPETAKLHPQATRRTLGQPVPSHRPGGDDAVRAGYRKNRVAAISAITWVVDGDVAFASYAIGAHDHRATRITLRDGLIWEILDTGIAGPSEGDGGGTTPVGAAAVIGPTLGPHTGPPDHDSAAFCTMWLAEHGDVSLAPAEHRRCMIAIASTYVNAEENSAPNTQVLFDPRVAKHGLGAPETHASGNGDEIRTEIGVITRVIRSIRNRQWTVEGDKVWIVYDGYLVTSVGRPGFAVAERFTIRNGLIWEIMIAPVATSVAPVG